VRRHALDRIVRDAAFSLLLRQTSGRHAASAWLGRAGSQVLSGAYSKDDELEADAFAVVLLGTAGGDTLAGERLLEKLAQRTSAQGVGIAGDYLATHPPLTERLANLRAGRLGRPAPS
jgi:predicted Zn-dependent protease